MIYSVDKFLQIKIFKSLKINNVKYMNDAFARRLVNARKIRCLSQHELYEKLGCQVPLENLVKYESAEKMPSEDILILLMRILRFKMDYFFRPFNREINVDHIKLCYQGFIDNEKEESIKHLAAYEIEKLLEIENILGVKNSFKLGINKELIETEKDAISLAIRVRKELNIGSGGIASPVELLDNVGVKIVEIDAEENFKAAYTRVGRNPFIVVNKNLTEEIKRCYIFYSLGNLLINIPKVRDRRNICIIFAIELLLPSEKFMDLVGSSPRELLLIELESIQRQYGISMDFLMLKAKMSGIITERQYLDYYKKKKDSLQFREKVEQSFFRNEGNVHFERLVYRALAKEIITTSKAAALLECSVNEVRNNLILL